MILGRCQGIADKVLIREAKSMDKETLTNHLCRLGKRDFEIACRIVLRSVFSLNAINVDGRGDGGTDFISVSSDGARSKAAYQITTQKSDIERKAYKDARKAMETLGADRFYFFTTLSLSETDARKIENDISNELGIRCICFGSGHIAAFLLDEELLNEFLDESSYPLPRSLAQSPDYKEMALHAYTLMSRDARSMREGIYDDTILLLLSDKRQTGEDSLAGDVRKFLGVEEVKDRLIRNRIGALFQRRLIRKFADGSIGLSPRANHDLSARKRIYERELSDLAAAQMDLMRRDFNCDWSMDDSRSVSVFIADVHIARQIQVLKEVKASVAINPIFHVEEKGLDSLKQYLETQKNVSRERLDPAVEKLMETAADHPLITKLARASVYVALEGANPIASAKALGAGRWNDFDILVEPTVAIPWICSQLYEGKVNRFFDLSKKSVKRAKVLGAGLHITYFYISECAGHLLRARNYHGLDLVSEELCFSPNAYISNYYSLKAQGVSVPGDLLEYLRTFSPSVYLERHDLRMWVRAVMTDLQTVLTRSGIGFIDTPRYTHDDCATLEREYAHYLNQHDIEKPLHLINHDVWALQCTNDKITREAQHWIILTYDRSLIEVGRGSAYSGWVASPDSFIDLTEAHKPLAEARYVSLIHSLASYSEKTLSAGARIIDRIVQYASKEMQNWEFREKLEQFKRDIVHKTDLEAPNALQQIDARTDEFLASHGIRVAERRLDEEEEVD
jgi:hypothetical protein